MKCHIYKLIKKTKLLIGTFLVMYLLIDITPTLDIFKNIQHLQNTITRQV